MRVPYDDAQRIQSISTAGLDQDASTTDALVRLYRSVLDRNPDSGGWGYWLPQYADSLALANIAEVFHDSAEFPATWTDFDGTVQDLSDNFDFVMWMYGHIIDRQPGNRSGWSWWEAQLDSGAWTRGQAIAHFSNLGEALTNPGIGGTDATTAYVAPNPANADVPQELAYTWDDAGNLTRIHETSEGVDQWQCFTYDNLHRLDLGYIHGSAACGAYQAIGPDPFNVDYAYDSIGNITSAAGTGTVSGSYIYSSAKPHAVTQAGSNSYAYDAAGNMTTRTTSMGTQTLVYDVLNRLVEITGAGDDMDALYDVDGVRVRRDLDGDTVFYLTDSYEIHDPASGPNTETIHFTVAGISVGSEVDGSLFVSAADHLGSGSISRDDTGATTTQRYTPYGAIRGGGGNGLPTDFTFTGQTDDSGTGLIDYNARHYDPQLGRFVMADPVLDDANRYSYVGGNPLAANDPTGNADCRSSWGYCPPNPFGGLQQIGDAFVDAVDAVDAARSRVIRNPFGSSGDRARSASGFSDPASYIAAEMRTNTTCVTWFVCDADFVMRVRGGGPWDHKDEIRATFGDDSDILIGSELWRIEHDLWSNFHYGFQVAGMEWRLDVPYLDCPSYQGVCGPGILGEEIVASEPFGADNPLDYAYTAAGAEFRRQYGTDFTDADLLNFLAPYLDRWSSSADNTAPQRVRRGGGGGGWAWQ